MLRIGLQWDACIRPNVLGLQYLTPDSSQLIHKRLTDTPEIALYNKHYFWFTQ